MNDDLYQLLGVDHEATLAQIKAAYRNLARTAHPDAGGDPEEFVRITTAYNVLEHADTRKAYDFSGEYGDENPLKVQHRVIQHIADMFENILQQLVAQNLPPERFDFIQAMNDHIDGLSADFAKKERKLSEVLTGFHKTNRLIKKKGEGRNIFSEIAEKRILELAEEYNALKLSIRDIRRVREELQRYESVVDLIRGVQSGAYPGEGRRGGGFWEFLSGSLTST